VAARTVKLADGTSVHGEEVPFAVLSDGAVTIETDDGAQLRLKPIVVTAFRTDQRSPEGERLYIVQCINQVLLVKPGKDDVT